MSIQTGHDSAHALTPDRPEIYDIAIVGYGPAGVACANLLGLYGLRTVVLERDPTVFPRQRAISIDDEALRIIRSMGLYEEVTATMHLGVTISLTGVNGKPFFDILPLPTESCGEPQGNFFHQPWLEAVLRAGVARHPSVNVLLGWDAQDLTQDDKMVTLHTTALETGAHEMLRARYVLACDGGSSPTRKLLAVPFAGRSYDEQWLDVQALVKRPFRSTPHFKFICDPNRPGVDCPCPGGYHRWDWRINKGEDAELMQRPEHLWALLAERGVTQDDIEIQRHWEYTFHVRRAATWRVGRVFLVGDAAHVMPPFAGQGISGAFRDAANLCWKLEAVLRGRSDERLLDTYQVEREPHVKAMTEMSVRMGRIVMTPSRPLALLRDTAFRLVSHLPGMKEALSRAMIKPTPLQSGFLAGPIGGRSAIGQLVCQTRVVVPGGHACLLDEALGNRFAILGMDADPRTHLSPEVLTAWEPFEPRLLTIRSGTSVVHEGEIGDPVGALWNWCARHCVQFLIIRPDHYVYAAGNASTIPVPALSASPSSLQTRDAKKAGERLL